MLRQSCWSLRSDHPPFPFFIVCFLTSDVVTSCKFFGNKYFLADRRTVCTRLTTDIAWQFCFLWWKPLENFVENYHFYLSLLFGKHNYSLQKNLAVLLTDVCTENSPFSDVKHSGPSAHHDFHFLFKTISWHVLQAPIPVVVIVCAEINRTLSDFVPDGFVHGHAHVVPTANPRRCLHLQHVISVKTILVSPVWNEEKLYNSHLLPQPGVCSLWIHYKTGFHGKKIIFFS